MRKNNMILMLALLSMAVLSNVDQVFAYGEQIGSALDRVIDWASKILGGSMVVIGLIFTGIRLAAHDEQALQKGGWVIVGGIIIFLAKNILDLIKGFAGF
jgi:type IV secretory pathway VirB2 component (pilin)